jgi:TRAP-type C4-dicarboxylate transport system permease small subunit
VRRVLFAFDDWLARLEDVFLIAAHAVIAVMVCLGVVLRYVFRAPFTWDQEFIVGLFTWMIFIGCSAAIRSKMHIRIESTGQLFARPGWRFMNGVGVGAGAVVIALMVWAGLSNAIDTADSLTPMLNVPQAVFDAALPVSGVFLLVHMLRILLERGAAQVFRSSTEDVAEEVQ